MFVVLGATGNTGSAVVETLLSKNQPVRVVVRSADKGAGWKAKGADVAVASLDDVSALTKAFEGAKGLAKLDELSESNDPASREAIPPLLASVLTLMMPTEAGEGFSRQYHDALQRSPDVVLAHAAVRALLMQSIPKKGGVR
ncbi:MAG: NAD-dependent epimerase/dehydratase family protein [Nitrospira sp. CG24B]|nr:MAG: NAD-dependent epimerase/dehydratase family protein [Nitrospira sp. CG24B]